MRRYCRLLHAIATEASMDLERFDEGRCAFAEKVIIEGICISYDLLREICLETGSRCVALEPPVPVRARPEAGP